MNALNWFEVKYICHEWLIVGFRLPESSFVNNETLTDFEHIAIV